MNPVLVHLLKQETENKCEAGIRFYQNHGYRLICRWCSTKEIGSPLWCAILIYGDFEMK